MEGGIKNIYRSERLFSQSIIEEFMIAANEAVARFIWEKKTPSSTASTSRRIGKNYRISRSS